jgi:hypothetical protein
MKLKIFCYSMWRNSFKKFPGLRTNLPHDTLDKTFAPTVQISNRANLNTKWGIKNRFGSAEEEYFAIRERRAENYEEKKEENIQVPISFKKFPKNLKTLFAFPHKRCRCHLQRMIANQIFKHEGLNFDRWLKGLLNV